LLYFLINASFLKSFFLLTLINLAIPPIILSLQNLLTFILCVKLWSFPLTKDCDKLNLFSADKKGRVLCLFFSFVAL
jgi:hypothetical protein